MRGSIVDARIAYPEVLHVEIKDPAGELWHLATQDAEWSPSDPDELVGRLVTDARKLSPDRATRPGYDGGIPVDLTARIHIEEGRYWADVPELSGCFASGDTLGELFESLQEGIALYLADQTSFHVDTEAWQEIAAVINRPAHARPELVKLLTRPRPD